MSASNKPISIVIAAMGGEGGGVLTDWLVEAANAEGLAVQSTSVPGVAQRTGATTYYIEIFPVPLAQLNGAAPILALAPSVGDVDLVVATELMEAARTVSRGYATPERTRLIASTHRVYAIDEKAAMGDGRADSEALRRTIEAGTHARLLFDMEQAAKQAGCIVNSVLLGAIAGSGVLPIPAETFEAGITAAGKAVDSNLRGFRAGLAAARGEVPAPAAAPHKRPHAESAAALPLVARAHAELPEPAQAMAAEGVRRLVAYQDQRYAALYLERLGLIWTAERDTGGDGTLTRNVARHLAVRMSFEDVIRVAQLKTDPARFDRIRAEAGAAAGQPVVVTDFLKPGIEEVCSLLPGIVARPILALARRRGWIDRVHVGRKVTSSGAAGFATLWLMARLKGWRRHGHRFGEEQRAIELWLESIRRALGCSVELAVEVAECARLVKGYGETWRRGEGNFRRIHQAVIVPAVTGLWPPAFALDAIVNARAAALADPEGRGLERTLEAMAKRAT
ncbi:indolepyruvate oxidoreductase subunit beta family protein [Magnetospirillum sp. SS-4]|uniref:indolepyruvate oxidoreductase subunit beta family protein n=1 Tax=Magnetospirillum sp. SS-4 TaxID=2681465 RepID=UPI0013845FB7|nr:indolepyruvate oxidoreductase subunit beta family protein [Magnetospirillum sp. SS-4]CAA7627480.1 Indolepyruvate oxidoreductase subunit B [Magnetospirillum sp. SS-4]